MFSGQYSQYPDLHLPSWNEFDCDDDSNAHHHNEVDTSNFEPQLINDLDKHISNLSGSSTSSLSAASSKNSPVLNSASSSISSATSYSAPNHHNQIFDGVDLLDLGNFFKDANNNNSHIYPNAAHAATHQALMNHHHMGPSNHVAISPASSCVSPTLTSTNSFDDDANTKHAYSDGGMNHYQLDSNLPAYQPFSISDAGIIHVKQEEQELDAQADPQPQHPQTRAQKSNLRSARNVSNSTSSSASTSTTTSKKKETAKSGRVKKPMTLVQRKAHNKIERKYRININSKIANLQRLVPWMSEDGVAFEIDGKKHTLGVTTSTDEDGNPIQISGNNKKLNKSMILDMVTEYLLLLKDECRKKDMEIAQLKGKLSN